jgi:hypothetical protein
MKTNICNIENITELCILLEDKLLEDKEYEKIEQNEQILHCVFIIVKECFDYLLFHENLEAIVRKVKEIRMHPKLSSRMKFKCMDIDDIIKVHLLI